MPCFRQCCNLDFINVTGNTRGVPFTYKKEIPSDILNGLIRSAKEKHPDVIITPASNHDCFADSMNFIAYDDIVTYFLFYNLPSGTTKIEKRSLQCRTIKNTN